MVREVITRIIAFKQAPFAIIMMLNVSYILMLSCPSRPTIRRFECVRTLRHHSAHSGRSRRTIALVSSTLDGSQCDYDEHTMRHTHLASDQLGQTIRHNPHGNGKIMRRILWELCVCVMNSSNSAYNIVIIVWCLIVGLIPNSQSTTRTLAPYI